MSVVSTGGKISSRVFTARILKTVLVQLPSSQAEDIRTMARTLQKKTGLGYYAALETVANLGVFLLDWPTSRLFSASSSAQSSSTAS